MNESQRRWGPLFHGTTHVFTPGDLILPRSKKVAHAAPQIATARMFAGGDGHVYEVEPVRPFTDNDVWEQHMKYSDGQREVVSRSGVRVLSEVPRSRRQSFYRKAFADAAAHNAALGYTYCFDCKDTHLPDEHL